MTTSGITTYELSALQMVEGFFNILGVAQEGEALTARMYQDGMRAYNGMIQTLSGYPHLWLQEEGELSMVADDPSYVVSPRALRVTNCRYHNILSALDTPMNKMSRQEYYDQPTKTTATGIPVNFYFDPKVDEGTLYLWPCPSASAATQYTIRYSYWRFPDVMTASNQTMDLPQQWVEPIMWNGAKRLCTQYPVNDPNLLQVILGQAKEFWDKLTAFDNEDASLYMQPDYMASVQP